jgi:hypothetical protein
VTLSKAKKKPGLERKGKVVTEIKDAIDKYSSAYVFTYDNMRNQKLKDLREQLKTSSRYGAHMSAAMSFCLSKCCNGQGLILVPSKQYQLTIRLLQRLLGIQMATFRLYLVCRWSCDYFEVYKEGLMHLGADDSS